MNARLILPAACALFALACGGGSSSRPDGGLAVCNPDEERFLVVRVEEPSGDPAAEAEVTAQNLATGQTVTALTNHDGVSTAVGTSLGSGSIRVTAQKGTRVSDPKQAQFSCGECGCEIVPDSLTLVLSP